jgi:ribonuclease HI
MAQELKFEPDHQSRGGSFKHVTIYTDGGCIDNPGPGGYGVVLLYKNRRKELTGGFRRTTNNRMEILAAIAGIEALRTKCRVTVYSDSQYLVNAIERGWARRWQARGWWRNREERAHNPDLWARLLQLCEQHEVRFRWVRGHAGNKENERCDTLARETARRRDLPQDTGYEAAAGGARAARNFYPELKGFR